LKKLEDVAQQLKNHVVELMVVSAQRVENASVELHVAQNKPLEVAIATKLEPVLAAMEIVNALSSELEREHHGSRLQPITMESKRLSYLTSRVNILFFSSILLTSLSFVQLRSFNSLTELRNSEILVAKLSLAQSIQSSHTWSTQRKTERRVVLVRWKSPSYLILLNLLLKPTNAFVMLVMIPELLTELLTSLIRTKFFVTTPSQIFQSEEMLMKSSDLLKHSNILMSSVKFAQLNGHQVNQPCKLIQTVKRLLNTGKKNTAKDLDYFSLSNFIE
jgi:hypothetical protein